MRNGLSKNGFKNKSLIKLSLIMGNNFCCDISRSDCFLSLDYAISDFFPATVQNGLQKMTWS